MTVGARVLGGRYRLGSVVGQGGMAVVYRAEDLTLGRTVAVKVLREQLGSEPEFLERFRREARAAARLNHPNVIAVYDVGEDADANYIVMEYVEGKDLKDIIRDEGALAPERVIDIGCQIAAALEYAHRVGLIHRDIKSQNVLVTPEARVKVADFGIAVALGDHSITQAGMIIGSVHYMAPEQAEGRAATAASDVYALGVVLDEMATGQLPFNAESPLAVARMQIETPPTPPNHLNPNVPAVLSDTILACLQKDPGRRPASAALVAAALRGQRPVAAQDTTVSPQQHTAVVPPVQQTGRSQRQRAAQRSQPAPVVTSHTDVLMPEPMIAPRMPPRRQPRQRRGGFPFWRFFLLFVVLAAIGGRLGWFLAQPKDGQSSRPTPGPVATAAPTPPPARPTLVPTRPPPTQQPVVQPTARPTAPPTATAGPPTPTQVPPTPTALPGTAGVPSLVGKNETEAAKALHDLGLTATVREQRSPLVREGEVVAQDPKPGSQVLAGSTVTITVGRGLIPSPKPKPEGVRVPNVEGMDKEQARHALEAAGFGVATNEDGAPDRKGQVINQKPAAGDTVQPGVNVLITIGV